MWWAERIKRAIGSLLGAGLCISLSPIDAFAQSDPLQATSQWPSWLILVALALVPIFIMAVTSFIKISVVLSLLRNALGIGQVPSGVVVAVLAAVLTFFVMRPVGEQMWIAAAPHATKVDWEHPLKSESLKNTGVLINAALSPLSRFLRANAGKKERKLFYDLASSRRTDKTKPIAKGSFMVAFPAFLITELAEAFIIGFFIFIPFMIVDLVIANIALALGMQMLPPTVLSLPFKLLLFVSIDGWYLLSKALVTGYN